MSTQSLDQNKNDYLNFYLEKTLGLQQVQISINNFIEYLFIIENFENYSDQEKTLTDKIISALKFKTNQYLIVSLTDMVSNKIHLKSKYQIIFQDNPDLDVVANTFQFSKKYQTYSPRILVLKPELKIKTWNLLKTLVVE